MNNDVFNVLSKIDVSEHVEEKGGFKYLSWAWAWTEVRKRYSCSYEIEYFNGKPYLFDEDLGYMVFVKVTIEGETKEMWLPVMDGKNNAMKNKPYSFEKTIKGKKYQVNVGAATMFDINKTIMRALVKGISMFGLGLYLYQGEDLPQIEEETPKEKTPVVSGVYQKKDGKDSTSKTEDRKTNVQIAKQLKEKREKQKEQQETQENEKRSLTEEEIKEIEKEMDVCLGTKENDELSELLDTAYKLGIDPLNKEQQNKWFAKKMKVEKVEYEDLIESEELKEQFMKLLQKVINDNRKRESYE